VVAAGQPHGEALPVRLPANPLAEIRTVVTERLPGTRIRQVWRGTGPTTAVSFPHAGNSPGCGHRGWL